MLEIRPITVNKNMEVIDGQHRLEACKILNQPIFYVIQEDSQDEDMILLNNSQKRWSLEDYVHFYSSRGKEAYKSLEEASKNTQLTCREVLIFLGLNGGTQFQIMKNGTFDKDLKNEIQNLKEKSFLIDQISRYIDEKTFGKKTYLKQLSFKRSLIILMNSHPFNFDTFIKKIEIGISRIHPCTTVSQYYELFKSIYNYKNQEPIE